MSGLATLADALNTKILACLVVPSREASLRMHLQEKLGKIGVLVAREIEINAIELSHLEGSDCVVMVEAGSKNERDNVLSVAVKASVPAFLVNVKASHPSWDRLAEFAKRKGLAKVIPLPSKSEARPVEPEVYVKPRGEEAEILAAAYRATEANAKQIETLRGEIGAAVDQHTKAVTEITRLRKELADVLAAREEELAATRADCNAKLEAQYKAVIVGLQEENAKLRTAEGKRAGGHAGQAERWKKEYKKQAEDEKTRADKLEAEVTALRAKKAPKISEEKVRMLLAALEAKALPLDLAVNALLALTKGEA